MGFNKRRMESERAAKATQEAEARRALGPQILADAEHLIATWNARQEAHMLRLFTARTGLEVSIPLRHPVAGVLLLSVVGARPPPDGV
jgi:hypothetical protein